MRVVFICACLFFDFIFASEKQTDAFRVFDETTAQSVKDFYYLNHTYQTLDFVLQKKEAFLKLNRKEMTIWEAIDLFDQIIDESDPDLDLPQSYHLFQTAEALRAAACPRWMILTGFIHDLGKILVLFDEPQWAVVGDTFPLGCAFSDKIVFSKYFKDNPDLDILLYQTPYGIYSPACGLDQVEMSWGHDEYLYHVVKDYLPEEALYIIRYHSLYCVHHEGAYSHLWNEKDKALIPLLKFFSQSDLYSKSSEPLNIDALKPYYEELVSEYFPEALKW